MRKHRVAFVGAGRVSEIHYASLAAMPDRVELVAVCDTRPEAVEQRQREWGVPGFSSVEELLSKIDVEALCLLLPHDVHREYVAIAARHGKHVFLEKPIAATREDAQEIAEIVRQSGITLLVCHSGLFHPAFQRALDLVRKGWLGRPLFARGMTSGWPKLPPWDFRLKKKQTGGGCWVDAGGHLVYCLREIFGEVSRVTGMTARMNRPEMEGEDHAAVVLGYTSGAIAELSVSYGDKLPGYKSDWPQGFAASIEIYGELGTIYYVIAPDPRVTYFSEVQGAMPPDLQGWQGWMTYRPTESYTYSFEAVMKHFLDCLDGTATPRVTASDALATLNALLGLYEQGGEEMVKSMTPSG